MSSLPRVSSLTKNLLSKPKLQRPPCLPRRPYTALAAPGVNVVDQVTNIPLKNEYTNQLVINANRNPVAVGNGPENDRTVNSEEVIKMNTAESSLEKKEIPSSDSRPAQRTAGLLSIPGHSLVSPSKLNFNQSRSYSDTVAGSEKCIPRKTKIDKGPLPCVIIRRPPAPCVTPTQNRWSIPEVSICLPCCSKVEKPLRCHTLDIGVNTCPKKTYRLPAYSECHKRYGKYPFVKECCYRKRVCHMRNLADREILPLIPIRDRQADILGFHADTQKEPWGT